MIMEDARFDALSRILGAGSTRRGVVGALAGMTGLALSEAAGKRRNRKTRRVAVEITDGELDGNGHPYVGLMVAQKADGTPLWRCSGTLLSPSLFLTAGHCVADDGEDKVARVEIWFDADVESGIPANGYPDTGDVGGTPYPHPSYDPDAFYTDDVGVVVLDEPFARDDYGALPQRNELDTLAKKRPKQDVTFTAVGYGLQQAFPDAASWKDQEERVRMVAHPYLLQINNGNTRDFYLLLSNNPITGGTCFGDSGGPNFIGSSKVIGAVTSYGMNDTCAGTGGVYRVDRKDALDWLYGTFGDHLPS
jgi:secreted trypsin-like serine protease